MCLSDCAYSVSLVAGARDCAREGFLATVSKSKVNGLRVVTDGHILSESRLLELFVLPLSSIVFL